MYELINNFPQQLAEAIALAQQIKLNPTKKAIHHVVITGMGGSGIGGILVKNWVADQMLVPIEVNQAYTLPAYINQHTLLMVISYSGNTEETLQALQAGITKQAHIICITAGGAISQLAKEQALDLIILPAGKPPRACLGYTSVLLLAILRFYKLLVWDFTPELQAAILLLQQDSRHLQAKAQQIAMQIKGKLPVIYATAPYEGVAIRFRQQLNENSKQLCWHHTIPALNHNELIGWQSSHKNLAVLMLGAASHDRTSLQQSITQAIIQKHTSHFHLLEAPGKTLLVNSLYFVHWCDWISFYLAQAKGVDPWVVAHIDQVKLALSTYY